MDTLHSFNKGIMFIRNEKINQNSFLKLEMNDEQYRKYINPLIYIFNYDNFKTIMDKLKEHQMDVSYFEDNKIKGDINLDSASNVMLSVPYEKGWIIRVNGKRVDYDVAYDTFILLNLDRGVNKIEMKFIPPGSIIGGIISILTFMLLFYKGRKLNA